MSEVIDETLLYQLLGERIRGRRGELRFSQETLAQALGLVRTSITNIESGTQRPPVHLLYAIAQALHVEVQTLFPSGPEVAITKSVPEETVVVGDESVDVPPKTASFIREVIKEVENKR